MPKAATTKTTKAPKAPKEPKEPKEARTPSAYQLFMKERLPEYKIEHPDASHKDAFKGVALEWKDSDRNPNKGVVREPKPKKDPKPKADKEAAPKRTRKKPAAKASSEAEEEEEDEAADDDASSN